MTANDVLQQEIKRGKISEKELIALFASDSIKRNHQKNGCFRGDEKPRVLKVARRYCNIRDNKDRTFTITKVHKLKESQEHIDNLPEDFDLSSDIDILPDNFNKMNRGLYQYICPIILSSAIEEHFKKNSFLFTPNMLAKRSKMVNCNYELIKYHIPKAEKEFQLSKSTIYDFFNKCDSTINYYITRSLQQLVKANLITVQDKYYIQPTKPTILCDGVEYIAVKEPTCKIATEQDIAFYEQCMRAANERVGIENDKERFYSKKSKTYKKVVTEELQQGGIKYFYKIYEIHCVNVDECKRVLEIFKYDEKSNLTQFNNAFIDKLKNNAQKRKMKYPSEYAREQFINTYADMCEIVIDNRTESLKERILSNDEV